MWSDDDVKFMSAALDVAIRGKGKVSPNPLLDTTKIFLNESISDGFLKNGRILFTCSSIFIII